ncbi:MAG: SMP-30/gluconolactonase/LRE family protein [Spirochaetes bacterium]|nr:SMP-30/gluconolactonase/LRE family protein [Spirochaetota bacterium]MBN2772396.1 SMP-30/gluconolactonase/LRE family protein [Spirochaetota bacterium]
MKLKSLFIVLLVLLANSSCFHFIRTGKVKTVLEYQVKMEDLKGARFYGDMPACENIYLDENSNRVYVTSLEGYIFLLDGPSGHELSIVKSEHVGGYALGIDRAGDGQLYAAICKETSEKYWKNTGGYIARVSSDLDKVEPLTDEYPAINGLAFDNKGYGYFATSNFSFIFPGGKIMRFLIDNNGVLSEPQPYTEDIGLANGLLFSSSQKRLYYSNTLVNAGFISSQNRDNIIVYQKTKMKEAFDDLCLDSDERIWMTDPINHTLKVYDPESDKLIRYKISGFGQASSCRIRMEEGEEILYITELVAPEKNSEKQYNGRGILRVPVKSFNQ